jgi:hypothetical protein
VDRIYQLDFVQAGSSGPALTNIQKDHFKGASIEDIKKIKARLGSEGVLSSKDDVVALKNELGAELLGAHLKLASAQSNLRAAATNYHRNVEAGKIRTVGTEDRTEYENVEKAMQRSQKQGSVILRQLAGLKVSAGDVKESSRDFVSENAVGLMTESMERFREKMARMQDVVTLAAEMEGKEGEVDELSQQLVNLKIRAGTTGELLRKQVG